jgi:hypothetical protein
MIAMAESYRVLLFQPGGKALENFRQPVQVGPQAIAFSARAKSVYVLNTTSNTVTAIPIEQFDPRRQLDLAGLVKYRSGVIDAYFDLLGGLFQYLKDCLCDHFLVNCPTCEEDEKDIFLGCVTFSGGQIKKICNFEKRQQVHTFPKLKYWLSLVPVIPLVGKAIEALCCLALPNFFAKQKAPQPSNSVLNNPTSGNFTTQVSANTLANTLSFVKGMGIRETFASSIMKAAGAGSILKDFTARRNKVFAPPQPAFQAVDVVGLSLDEAKTRLAAANVTVDAVTSYDPARPRENIGAFLRSPRDLAPGSGVVLVEDQGAVRFVAPSDPASGALRDGIAQGLKQLAANTASVRKVAEAHSDLEASLDTTRKALADAQSRLDETAAAAGEAANSTRDIRGEMAAVQRSLVEAQQQVAQVSTAATQAVTLGRQLQTQVEAANRALAQSQPALTAAASLQDQVTALKTELARVQKASEDALTHRDQQISGLQERLKAVDDLSSQVAALTKATPPKRAPTKSTKPRE